MYELSGQELQPDRLYIESYIIPNRRQEGVRRLLQGAPDWILTEAFDTEMMDNWEETNEVVYLIIVPLNDNRVGYRKEYMVKETGDNSISMKARKVLPVNRDKDRLGACTDSEFLTILRLAISLGVLLGLSFGPAEVQVA